MRRRTLQAAYNTEHGITPTTIIKAIREMEGAFAYGEADYLDVPLAADSDDTEYVKPEDVGPMVEGLRKEMTEAAKAMEFERAAELREITLSSEMRARAVVNSSVTESAR